jgi:tyrosine-protein phosphatase YwqE
MFWFDFDDLDKKVYIREWYDNDLEKMKTSKNVLSEIPKEIDLLILDGGEFSTYPEWNKLKNRTKIVVLDDTNYHKCSKIVQEILDDVNYKSLHVVKDDRNGFCVFEKIK